MGQKVNPNGFRTGVNKDWNATWVAPKKDIAAYILEDHKIRKFLNDEYGLKAGLNNCSIARAQRSVRPWRMESPVICHRDP